MKVVLYGVGAVGSLIATELLRRKGVEVVGAVDIAEEKVGKDLGDVIGLGRHLGTAVSDDIDSVLSKVDADIVVHATSSFLKDVYSQIVAVMKNGVSVVSTCEELCYPYATDRRIVEEIDRLAKEHRVTVLGAGINPGFLMDTLVIVLTGVCQKINRIEVKRVMNATTRRAPFQKKIGAGLTVGEFEEKMRTKIITGHVGLEQSIMMIADALGWKLGGIQVNTVEPIIADKRTQTQAAKVEPGCVAGLRQTAMGMKHGKPVIVLDFQAYVGATEEYDSITIDGTPAIHEKISPCIHGDIGTVAMIVNSIPKVLNAPPGLVTMKDLPIPSAWTEELEPI